MATHHRRGTKQSTAQVLSQLADGPDTERLALRSIMDLFGRRAFAVMFLLAAILAMNPVPGMAGGLSGPLVVLAGLQLIVGMRRPWLPAFVLRKSVRRSFFVGARDRLLPRLQKLEHLIKPRLTVLFDAYGWNALSGLLLAVFGVLVLLPIPFTNFAFGVLLLFYFVAYIERDGALLIVNWIITAVVIAIFGILSGTLVDAVHHWLGQLVSI